jgi:DNA polymerase-3 subunit gamma/tau
MSQSIALYRKYRSNSFDEVVGQDHIIDNLKAALKKDQVSHAYLFTGPRGTGKTSTARILAREVNGLNPDDTEEYIDIIEIDAASHNSVDDIRELREGVMTVPTSLDKKVYIIDEVHMLSGGAFNALLKTLEEPPTHVLFILATTEIHKIPATIISRTQRYNFHPPTENTIANHLRHIAKNEDLDITDEALAVIATEGQGSFRDGISVLDQIATHNGDGEINKQAVEKILGLASNDQIQQIIESVFTQHNPKQLLTLIEELVQSGLSITSIASQIRTELRSQLVDEIDQLKLDVTKQLLSVDNASDKRLSLELVLLSAIQINDPNQQSDQPSSKNKPESKQEVEKSTAKKPTNKAKSPDKSSTKSPVNKAKKGQKQQSKSNSTEKQDATPDVTEKPASSGQIKSVLNDWSQIIGELKENEPSLYAVLRQAAVANGDNDNQIDVSFRYKLHYKKASQPKKATILKQLIESKINGNIDLQMMHKPNTKAPESNSSDEAPSQVDSIRSVLGGDVVRLSE